MARDPLGRLRDAIGGLVAWLDAERVPGAIIGGVAASVLGRPRLTKDVDAVVWLEDRSVDAFVRAAAAHGIEPRIADPVEFAERSRVLLLKYAPTGTDLDVSLGGTAFERELIENAVTCELKGLRLRIPRPEDLVVMKALAHRRQDAADIEGILQANPGLDRARVRSLVRDLADALDAPELLVDLERIFESVPPR